MSVTDRIFFIARTSSRSTDLPGGFRVIPLFVSILAWFKLVINMHTARRSAGPSRSLFRLAPFDTVAAPSYARRVISPDVVSPRPVVLILPVGLLAYSGAALARHWWLAGLAAPVVAALLWYRHPRARFSAYVLLSVIVVRGLLTHAWLVTAFGVGMLLAMQLPSARTAWISVGSWRRQRGGSALE